MSGLNLKVNYLVGAQAECQAGGLAQATEMRLFTESGCDELPQCQLIETESNKVSAQAETSVQSGRWPMDKKGISGN